MTTVLRDARHRAFRRLFVVFAVLAPGVASAAPPPGGFTAVDTCGDAACRRGLHALRIGDWRTAAAHLRGAAASPGPEESRANQRLQFAAAVAERRSNRPWAAAHLFAAAATGDDLLADFAAYRGIRAVLAADRTGRFLLDSLMDRGGLDAPFPGRARTRLRAEAAMGRWSTSETLDRALRRADDRRRLCAWALDRVGTRPPRSDRGLPEPTPSLVGGWLSALYSRCPSLPTGRIVTAAAGGGWAPDPANRIARAETLYDAVEFERALEVLDSVDLSDLQPPRKCRGQFRLARTLEQLDRSSRSADAYREVLTNCSRENAADVRVRSLYALGTHHFHRGRGDRSAKRFRQILDEFPERSHADDALLFLARLARQRGDREREIALLRRALDEYPVGDMVHTLAWEVLELPYRRGDYRRYVELLAALDIPERTDEPSSQGRLAYFRGESLWNLDRREEARAVWASVWRRYPLSFYGYLSRLRLADRGGDPAELLGSRADAAPSWRVAPPSSWSPAAHLLDLGLTDAAADIADTLVASRDNAAIRDADRWRLAFVLDAANRHHRSHEIPRRQITGRPWVDPAVGRRARWRVAFPAGFVDRIHRTVARRMAQSGAPTVRPELVSALIREESGYRPTIESRAGAVGLMQLIPPTAKRYGHLVDERVDAETLTRPRANLRIGVAHLAHLSSRFDGHPAAMLAAYNAGAGAAGGWLTTHSRDPALWVESIPYRQTRHYTKRVLGSYAAYQLLAGRTLDPRVGERLPAP